MRVCTLHLAITLGIRRFSREIIKKYASYCIIACVLTWRRRRDSNPRDPFGAYTISNRARSTKLRDFSVFALRFVVLFCFAWLVRDKQQWEL